jgi:hypothetical protein
MMAGTRTTQERSAGTAKAADRPPERPRDDEREQTSDREHVCNVAFCPIGLALSTVQGAAPDVMEHLLKAAQEFFLAARAVMDNRAKDFEDAPVDRGMERIEIS